MLSIDETRMENGNVEMEMTPASSLEQFVLLAKSAHGTAAKSLVEQAVSSPELFVFSELLACPNIAALAENDDTRSHHDLLTLFAYGTIDDLMESLPPIDDVMMLKLQQLTIASLAAESRSIPYELLLRRLKLNNVRQLEDIFIDAVYKGIVKGKLDPMNQRLEIESWQGRDIRPETTDKLIDALETWANRCQTVLFNLEDQMNRANANKQKAIKEQRRVENEACNLKKTLKIAGRSTTPDMEEPVEATSSKVQKDTKRLKAGLRGSMSRNKAFLGNNQ